MMVECNVKPQSYLNFKGDVTDGLVIGQRMGPTTYGAWMYVVGWDVLGRGKTKRTRVGMSAVNPVRETE